MWLHRNKYLFELKKDFIPFWYGQKAALFPRHGSGGCFYFLKVVLFMYLRKDMRYKLVLLSFPVMWVPFHNDHVVVKLLWVREVPNAIRWLKKSSKFYYLQHHTDLSRKSRKKMFCFLKFFFNKQLYFFRLKVFSSFVFIRFLSVLKRDSETILICMQIIFVKMYIVKTRVLTRLD